MLTRVREFINKSPWLGWVLALLLLGVSVFMFVRGRGGRDPYSPERMKETVVIKFTDTGEEIEMPRGRLDQELRRRGDKIDPSTGIINPKTGKPTGFPFDKDDWDTMIARINAEKEQIRKETGKTVTSVPRPSPTPAPTPAQPAGKQ